MNANTTGTAIVIPKNPKQTKITNEQLQLLLYKPCSCKSGKKYKFCCYKK